MVVMSEGGHGGDVGGYGGDVGGRVVMLMVENVVDCGVCFSGFSVIDDGSGGGFL